MSVGRGLVQVPRVSMVTTLTDALVMTKPFLVLLVVTAILLMLAKFIILGNAVVQQVPCCHDNTLVYVRPFQVPLKAIYSTRLGCVATEN